MTPQEYKRACEKAGLHPFAPFPVSAFAGTPVSAQTQRFLTEAGLPDGAGPFLSFHSGDSAILESASEAWDLPPEFEVYTVIGSDGAGNPIVLCPNDSIAYLDHDRDFEECYINKDVSVLAEASLLAPGYEPTEPELARFVEFLRQSDPRALEAGSFWSYEIAQWSDRL